MGHDIYARRVSEAESDRLYEEFSASAKNLDGKEWSAAYDKYKKAAHVSYLRRSAGNPLNTIIYQALDAMSLYAGCSGCGAAREFTRAQIVAALESLPGCAPGRPRNFADGLIEMFEAAGAEVVSGRGKTNGADCSPAELEPEYRFLRDILRWMDEQKRDSIEIDFG
jgi:hypothetical protein